MSDSRSDGLLVKLHRRSATRAPLYIRVKDVVLLAMLPVVDRADVPTGDYDGMTVRLRHGGEVDVMESPEEFFAQVNRALDWAPSPAPADPEDTDRG